MLQFSISFSVTLYIIFLLYSVYNFPWNEMQLCSYNTTKSPVKDRVSKKLPFLLIPEVFLTSSVSKAM